MLHDIGVHWGVCINEDCELCNRVQSMTHSPAHAAEVEAATVEATERHRRQEAAQ